MNKIELMRRLDEATDSYGPVYARITTETQVIWVEVTGVKEVTVLEPPWQSDVIELQTRPIPEGVGARMERPEILSLPSFPNVIPNVIPEHEDPAEGHYGEIVP